MTIQPFGFYLIRRPLISVDNLFLLHSNPPSEDYLKHFFSNPTLQETLYIASPTLFGRFQEWLNGEDISEKTKLIQTLFKYYLRMGSRCTPYGMFAGCALGEFSDETQIIFDDPNPYYKHIRLDTNYLSEIVNYLLSHDFIISQLRFYTNNTIYTVGKSLHYLFYSYQNNKREYAICAIENSEFLDIILNQAKHGITLSEFINTLISDEISEEEAKDFFKTLIDEQILFSEIEPTISGENFFDILIEKLNSIAINRSLLNNLTLINSLLKSPNLKIEDYQQIQTALNAFLGKKYQDFIQTDLYFNTQKNTISHATINDFTKKFEKIACISHLGMSDAMNDFKSKFYARYEEAEIPLSMALDNESGIGYGHFANNKAGILPLIEDITTQNTTEQNIEWAFWKKFTTEKLTEALRNKDFEIKLTDKDLATIRENHNTKQLPFPPTFYAFGSIYKDNNQAPYFILKDMAGASALPMLGRFANGDKRLREKLIECADYEQNMNKDAIFAEVIHIPEARIGNISARPQLRNYEIPYHTPSALEASNQILVEDLMISVKNGEEVILRSKKLNKRIIPRLSSAHNYENGLNIYRFLCDLQHDHENINIGWHWHIFKHETFLPRVSYQNIILSPATWNLNLSRLNIQKNEISIQKLKEIRSQFSIPKYITLAESDNELWIDFENEQCLILLKDYLQKNNSAVLKEVLFSAENCILQTNEGNITNEIIIPFKNLSYEAKAFRINEISSDIQRSFSVGSEWLYFKIYCGEKTADELLSNQLKFFVDELLTDNIIEQFFFIRYQDPEPHLRLRFKGNQEKHFYAVIIEKLNILLQNEPIHKIQIDTYNRELERYHEATMLLSEQLFFVDSLEIMKFLNENQPDEARIIFALKRMNSYLNNFNFSITEKKNFVEKMQQSFLAEFGGESELKKKLNDKFRLLSNDLYNAFDVNDNFDVKDLTNQIEILTPNRQQLFGLLSSYIHMFINRLFVSNNRTYELLLYHFLTKLYIREMNLQLGHK